ncbi:sulfite exporter TauE/SafE family protein [Leptothoe kymatousa]|uniref:Probable membrane transporter protein n=1 Tax=Leptothoe kymatousa TAU-MAC 1615 TaxID=2364775 RepID=A0ABS5Y4B8_9CYAN|nr:sulfite exporter TauE/SafE family protein [Leptothoe kymatousa]MBT9312677.1 sulfite exporter TauE/SafE family protein [Leptothoe kymatousa TAU-MAC 1615]
MVLESWLLLASGGVVTGILAGLLGIGGGVILVPLMITLGYAPIKVVATSSLAIAITAIAGSIQNWRIGCLDIKRVVYLGVPALMTVQLGVLIATQIPAHMILLMFGAFLIVNIYLIDCRQKLSTAPNGKRVSPLNPLASELLVGAIAGLLTGILGVGGGIVMITLQMLLLGRHIKAAIQTSLGVLAGVALSACLVHGTKGNLLVMPGLTLGLGSLLGVRLSTRFLPKLPDATVKLIFRIFLAVMSAYVFWQAYQIFPETYGVNPYGLSYLTVG